MVDDDAEQVLATRARLLPRGRLLSTYVEIGTSLDPRPELDPRALVVRSLRLFAGDSGFPRDEDGGTTFVVIQIYADLVPAEADAIDAVLQLGELSHHPQAAEPALLMMGKLSTALMDSSYSQFAVESTWARTLGMMVQGLTGQTPSTERVDRARQAQIARLVERFSADPNLTPESIAAALGISRRTLYDLSSPMVGGISEHIRSVRTGLAARLLSLPDWDVLSIADVARRTGFSNVKQMRRSLAAAGHGNPEEIRRRGATVRASTA